MRLLHVLILISFSFSMDVVTIGDHVFLDKDFFTKYGKDEWSRSDEKQKDRMLNDYIKREACAIQAKSIGFLNDPSIAIKLRDRSNMVMVNSVYEELVAKPLVSKETLSKTRNNIKVEIDVSHILVAYKDSKLQQPPNRTKDEAFLLAQNIKGKFESGNLFNELAKKHSDDLSAQNNGGSLGWVGWGRTFGTFQDVAFKLDINTISDPVLTDYGYHLVLVKEKRASEHAELMGEELEAVVYNASRGTVSHLLRNAATSFDSLKLSNAKVEYNDIALSKIVNLIVDEKDRKKISGQYKVDLVSLFDDAEDVGVVCVYNNRGVGIKWFSQKLRGTPSSRHPNLENIDNIKAAFNIILLQDIAVKLGNKKQIHSGGLYINQVKSMENSLLYDTYLKWLVNTAPKPDSLLVSQYYEKNKEEKYRDPVKIVVREIRVLNRELADSLLLEIQYGLNFEEAAILYSKTNPSRGGLMQPFSEGKYNEMGNVAYTLANGDISQVIENLDRSFSIIRVEEKLPEQYSELKKVYTRIESLLIRESQKIAKENGVEGLFEKLNIIINPDFFNGAAIEKN